MNVKELLFERLGRTSPILEERHKAIAAEIISRIELERDFRSTLIDSRTLKLSLVTENDCLVVTSHSPRCDGYINMRIGGKSVFLHRYVYEAFVGIIPEGLLVRHLCNNRRCINPAHLKEGTSQDNSNDRTLAGNNISSVGLENPNAKLTKTAIRDILTKRMSQGAFSRLYGVHQTAVGKVQRGKTYKMEVEECGC